VIEETEETKLTSDQIADILDVPTLSILYHANVFYLEAFSHATAVLRRKHRLPANVHGRLIIIFTKRE
jgi:uncharacterized protein YqgQ